MSERQRTAVPLVNKEEFKESWPQKRDSSRGERDNRVTEQKKIQLSFRSIHDCREQIAGRVEVGSQHESAMQWLPCKGMSMEGMESTSRNIHQFSQSFLPILTCRWQAFSSFEQVPSTAYLQ